MAHIIVYCCCGFCKKHYPERYMPYDKWNEWKKGTSNAIQPYQELSKRSIFKKLLKKSSKN